MIIHLTGTDPEAFEGRLVVTDGTLPTAKDIEINVQGADDVVVARACIGQVLGDTFCLTEIAMLPDADRFSARGDLDIIWARPFIERLVEREARQDQARFRSRVMTAYGGRCALTGYTEPAVLEAAHLRDWRVHNQACNGILLRVDLHRLLDAGLLAINADFTVSITREDYRRLDGRRLNLPKNEKDWPRL